MNPKPQTNSQAQLRARIQALAPWFHNMNLDGIWTAPDHFLGDYPNAKFKRFAQVLPADLRGKSVLDVGCNAGFYSMEMKRRGADHVVAIDSDTRYLAQARLAAEVSGFPDIEFRQLDVYDVAELGEKFDLVVFMGVLYHLRHPLLALDLLREHCCADLMLFQSMQRGAKDIFDAAPDYPFEEQSIFRRDGYPAAYFVEREYAHDWTNWWIPNRACVEAMLRSAGFSVIDHPEDEVYLCRVAEPTLPGQHAVYPAHP
jgi:tRNA (mo5U34)-methyltransferase